MSSPLTLTEALNWAYTQLNGRPENAARTVIGLASALRTIHAIHDRAAWQAAIAECRRHPVFPLIMEDPLTRRSFTQPRGYAGDAELLDVIYNQSWEGIAPEPSPIGAAIFQHTIACRAPSAVRSRRDLLAGRIEETCAEARSPHILSVACGHLRELARSPSFLAGRTGRFVGLDQDAASLAEATRSLPASSLETVVGSIKLLFGRSLGGEKFDFIYTAGLYDYLDEGLAQRLTARMFDMLRPGGRLLIANFQPGVEDVGYMEAFMNWTLIYRDRAAMERVAAGIPATERFGQRVYGDDAGSIVFLEVNRKK